ncbi:MAG: hypothetical protein ACRBI6_22295, partial [Acidimicrobiales bacterium]
MSKQMENIRTDRAIAVVLVAALVIITAMTMIARASINRADDEVAYFEHALVAPSRDLKVISDLYAVAVIDTVNRGSADIFTVDEVIAGLEEARETGPELWAEIEGELRGYHPDHQDIWDEIDRDIDVANVALDDSIALLRANGIGAIGALDGELYDVIDPLTAALDNALVMTDAEAKQLEEHFHTESANDIAQLLVGLGLSFLLLGGGGSWLVRTTRRNLLAQEVSNAEARRLGQMVDSSDLGMMYADASFDIQYVNPSLDSLMRKIEPHLSVRVDEIVGGPIDRLDKDFRSMLGGQLPVTTTKQIGDAHLSLMVSEITDSSGNPTGYLMSWDDVTADVESIEKERVSFERTA